MLKKIINAIQTDRLFFKGQKSTKSGDYTASINFYDKAITISPAASWIYLHKAISLAKSGLYEGAIELVNTAIKINDKKHAYFLYLGIFNFDIEKYDEAENAFKKSLELSPNNTLVTSYLNLINVINGKDIVDSLKNIRKNIRGMNSEFIGRFLIRCEKVLLQNKNTVLSFEDCIRDERSKETNISLHIDEIMSKIFYFFNSKTKLAHQHVIEARRNLRSGLIESSIDNYKKALVYQPKLSAAVEGLVDLYTSNKMYDAFFNFVKQEPSLNEFASLLDKENNLVLKDEKSDQIVQSNASLILSAGQLHYHMGIYDKSFRCFNTLSKHYSTNYFTLYYCGLCKLSINNVKEAFTWFKKSMETLNPTLAEKRLDEMIKCYK